MKHLRSEVIMERFILMTLLWKLTPKFAVKTIAAKDTSPFSFASFGGTNRQHSSSTEADMTWNLNAKQFENSQLASQIKSVF